MIKIIKLYIVVMLAFLVWLIFDVMRMIDLNQSECNAIGAQIVTHGNGNKICRYVRK